MICSSGDTGEGSVQGKVSINTKKKNGFGLYLMPLVMALPIAAGMALVVHRFWPTIHKLLSILIKLVVKA